MESNPNDTPHLSLRERFWKSWFPPAAVVGGVATLVAAAMRVRPEPRAPAQKPDGGRAAPGVAATSPTEPPLHLARAYVVTAVLGRAPESLPFVRSLDDLAVDASDHVFALGDGEVRVLGPDGRLLRRWRISDKAQCLAVGPDGRVYVGGAGRVEVYDATGSRVGGFGVGDAASPANVTAIAIAGTNILVADASARLIRRVDPAGRPLGLIGDQSKTKSFILPNGSLDLDVDTAGIVRATDTGRHQVTAWTLDGTPVGKFGKFGMADPVDFVGCCNPVNLAMTRDGKIVTAEKMIARVKVFEPDGRLIAFIGPEHFDQKCTHIHLATDSRGRLLAADPVRREITVFAQVVKIAVNEPFCRETASHCVAGDTARDYEPLAALAREHAGAEVRFTYYPVEADLVRALASGEMDGAIAKTWTALRACTASGLPFERLCDLSFPDGELQLRGVFITRADGPARSLADVAGARLTLGRPDSYENSHAVDRALRDVGVEPARRESAGGCIPAAVAILDGEADIAVVSSYCTRYGLDQIVGKPGAFRIVGETAPIPFATVALTARVPAALRAAIARSWLSGTGATPGRCPFPGGFHPPAPWTPEELRRA